MMVPALAFAWWFAAVPAQGTTAPATHAVAQATPTDDDAAPGPDLGAPRGWHQGGPTADRLQVKLVTPAMIKMAETFINLPLGSERFATVDGKRYVFVLERHYHPPGFQGAPNGWHKGVTMYELRDQS